VTVPTFSVAPFLGRPRAMAPAPTAPSLLVSAVSVAVPFPTVSSGCVNNVDSRRKSVAGSAASRAVSVSGPPVASKGLTHVLVAPAPGPAAAPSPNSPAVSISVLKGDTAVRVAASNPAVAPLCSSSDIFVSDMHVSVSDTPVSSARIFDSISDTTLSNTERKQEKENKEETSQRTRENKDKLKDIDIQDQTSLSQYDVSMFSASDLFECVNIPECMSQYDKNEEEELEHVCVNPIVDASSGSVSDFNDFVGL